MTIGTRLYTWLYGEPVGTDEYGNRYFRLRGQKARVKGGGIESRERRWVLYAGVADASKVPPEWHGWLHHSSDKVPSGAAVRLPWQKRHQPNPTGTTLAYHPRGSVARGGHRASATGDYEAWTP